MVTCPLVDDTQSLTVMEVTGLWGRLIELLCRIHEIIFQLVFLIDEDGIGNHYLCQHIQMRGLAKQFVAEGIDVILSRRFEP